MLRLLCLQIEFKCLLSSAYKAVSKLQGFLFIQVSHRLQVLAANFLAVKQYIGLHPLFAAVHWNAPPLPYSRRALFQTSLAVKQYIGMPLLLLTAGEHCFRHP